MDQAGTLPAANLCHVSDIKKMFRV